MNAISRRHTSEQSLPEAPRPKGRSWSIVALSNGIGALASLMTLWQLTSTDLALAFRRDRRRARPENFFLPSTSRWSDVPDEVAQPSIYCGDTGRSGGLAGLGRRPDEVFATANRLSGGVAHRSKGSQGDFSINETIGAPLAEPTSMGTRRRGARRISFSGSGPIARLRNGSSETVEPTRRGYFG